MTVKTFIQRMEDIATGDDDRVTILTGNQYKALFIRKPWPPVKAFNAVRVGEIREAIQQYRANEVAETLTK